MTNRQDASTKEKLDQDVDYYEVLGIQPNATGDQIKKAYRKQAKIYHPDVNDSPEAEKMFVQIKKAHHVLTDVQLKAEFDGKIKAKVVYQQRLDGMNSKRRLLREELEARERFAKRVKITHDDDVDNVDNKDVTGESKKMKKPSDLKREAERIRESGGYDALHKMFQAKQAEKQRIQASSSKPADVIVKWTKKGVMTNKDVNAEMLKDVFQTLFGPVSRVTKIENKRKAIISFKSGLHAQSAAEYWTKHTDSEFMFDIQLVPSSATDKTTDANPKVPFTSGLDYESATLLRFKQKDNERKQREAMLRKLQEQE
jgi:curved DNA-binding protein CbpA